MTVVNIYQLCYSYFDTLTKLTEQVLPCMTALDILFQNFLELSWYISNLCMEICKNQKIIIAYLRKSYQLLDKQNSFPFSDNK